MTTLPGRAVPPAAPNAVTGVARGSALNIVGAAATAALSFAVVAVITRGMTKADAGVVFTATSIFVLVESLARFGADSGVVYHLAGTLAHDRRREAADVLLASLLPVVVGSALAAVVMIALIVPLEHLVTGGAHGGSALAIVIVLAVCLPFAATYDVMTAATRALGSQRPTVLVERLLRPILQLAAVVIALAAGAGSAVIVAAWTGPYLLAFVVMTVWLVARLRRARVPRWSPGWRRMLRPVWAYTGPRAAAGVLQSALQRLDVVLVSALVSLPAAAVYTGATRFVVVGQLGNQAVGYSVQPQLRRLLARAEGSAAFELFQASTTWIIGLTWPLYLTVISMAPLLLKILGAHYGGGANTAVIVTAAMLVGAACGLVDIALLTVGKSVWNLANVALGLAINVAIDVILLPHIGIDGAAIGWAASIVVCNLVPLWQVHRQSGLHPVSWPWARVMAYALGCFLVLPEIGRLGYSHDWIGPIAGLAVGSALYLALVWRDRVALRIHDLRRRRPVPRGRAG